MRPNTPAPGCLAMGTNKVKKCMAKKIILRTMLTIAAEAEQVERTNQKGPLSFLLFEPHSPQF
jgi:hypothetical protein